MAQDNMPMVEKTVCAEECRAGNFVAAADDDAVAALAKDGFDAQYGARPLRRAIQNTVEDAVAEKMLDGTLRAGDTARLTVEDNKLCVTK